VVDQRTSPFRLTGALFGLVFFGVSSCGKSSDERSGAGDPDAGTSGDAGDAGDAGSGGTGQGGSAPSGGDAGTSTGGTSSSGGDGGLGGSSGSAGSAGRGGSSGGGGASSGAGGAGNGGSGGGGGMGVTYAACQFGSGIARTVIAKRDAARDRCVVLVLAQPGSNTLGLALPMSWGVESAFYSVPASGECLLRGPASGAVAADSGSGTVTRATGFIIDVDVTLAFAGGTTEDLEATGLDASRGCPF
jgi:hypothetical protein